MAGETVVCFVSEQTLARNVLNRIRHGVTYSPSVQAKPWLPTVLLDGKSKGLRRACIVNEGGS